MVRIQWLVYAVFGTTIVTFLLVFLIQNAQHRDAKAIHLKLDELIHSVQEARDRLVGVEEASDEELTRLDREFRAVHKEAEDGSVAAEQAVGQRS